MSNLEERERKANQIFNEFFGESVEEALRREKIKPGSTRESPPDKFVTIPLKQNFLGVKIDLPSDNKIEEKMKDDKIKLLTVTYENMPSVKEKEKLEKLLLKEIQQPDAGLIDGELKPEVKLIMEKIKKNEKQIKDDFNEKVIRKFSKYETGEGKKTKKRRRRKTKRKKNKKKKTKKKN